ncbi:MAG: MFS transporter [Acidobacteriota bacterium]
MGESSPPGLGAFLRIWLGQSISLFGSGLTAFAVGVWTFETTGSVTLFSLIAVAASLPPIFLSPFAGALLDRHDRRWLMILSDAGAALATGALVLLIWSGALQIWHLFVIAGLSAAFGTFQHPAFSAVTTLLVPREHLGRAAGLVQMGQAGAQILAPLVAGFLLIKIQLAGVIAVDLATFLLAVILLLTVRIPRPEVSVEGAGARSSLWREAAFGWHYIRRRGGLLRLLAYFAGLNFLVPLGMLLAVPLVLSFRTAAELGTVQAIGGIGFLVGSIFMAGWGGPKKKILGILGLAPLISVGLVVTGATASVPWIACGLFLVFFTFPILNGCSQAIWQTKVEPDVQGRVFAIRSLVAQGTAPLGFLLAGPLSDRVFGPLLAEGGPLADTFVGQVIGVGAGRGVGLLMVTMGGVFLVLTLLAFASGSLRRLEDELPDAVLPQAAAQEPSPTDSPEAEPQVG